ncbi:hypothetical protein AR9_g169 [Bacillus phage AR9]|uniref:Uncharacterized protein n=2 Tax=Bacillus phage PBS1 TaxID=10683 RepID=A0A172JI71_BPPB1|nr:hypothetical protein BI022_gp168 [Bacillus phage AR9]YP_009664259.1 hypothetical protein FK780_gp057 [Bacillus phage PBS1]QXN70092.1 hypothetical protein INTERNEXUS_51 [Bacillus phage vB_BspM_Internexus]WCS68292.1 hypothetical protein Goe21_01820 [Bacillus phage vB_BsuM-Goe21]AMS01253.1 hypothetical protein AR9_g169 [Bacillus phage AR9]AST99879.1 hypothetical protein PBI_PBS1_57 [Bacillus phage PBS1]BDE75301.1 hypothetical protein [Bacillus phage PBS1]
MICEKEREITVEERIRNVRKLNVSREVLEEMVKRHYRKVPVDLILKNTFMVPLYTEALPKCIIYRKDRYPKNRYVGLKETIKKQHFQMYHIISNIKEEERTVAEQQFLNYIDSKDFYSLQMKLLTIFISTSAMTNPNTNYLQNFSNSVLKVINKIKNERKIEFIGQAETKFNFYFSDHFQFDRMIHRGIPYHNLEMALTPIVQFENYNKFKKGTVIASQLNLGDTEISPIILVGVTKNEDKEIEFTIITVLYNQDKNYVIKDCDDFICRYYHEEQKRYRSINYKSNKKVFRKYFPTIKVVDEEEGIY